MASSPVNQHSFSSNFCVSRYEMSAYLNKASVIQKFAIPNPKINEASAKKLAKCLALAIRTGNLSLTSMLVDEGANVETAMKKNISWDKRKR